MAFKKIIGWAAVIFLAYYMFAKPPGLATAVHHLLGLLQSSGALIATFLRGM